jgi:hypothetical protein
MVSPSGVCIQIIFASDCCIDAAQPAFLQRLRGQIAGDESARREPAVTRNKKLVRDDEDDAPTYVLEDTNESLTKAEYEALVAGKGTTPDECSKASETKDQEPVPQPKDKLVEVGKASKKRKAVKVIGADEEGARDAFQFDAKIIKKPKKKSKPVKLSFGDQEGE